MVWAMEMVMAPTFCGMLLAVIELGQDFKNKINSALDCGDSNILLRKTSFSQDVLSEKVILNHKWLKALNSEV